MKETHNTLSNEYKYFKKIATTTKEENKRSNKTISHVEVQRLEANQKYLNLRDIEESKRSHHHIEIGSGAIAIGTTRISKPAHSKSFELSRINLILKITRNEAIETP